MLNEFACSLPAEELKQHFNELERGLQKPVGKPTAILADHRSETIDSSAKDFYSIPLMARPGQDLKVLATHIISLSAQNGYFIGTLMAQGLISPMYQKTVQDYLLVLDITQCDHIDKGRGSYKRFVHLQGLQIVTSFEPAGPQRCETCGSLFKTCAKCRNLVCGGPCHQRQLDRIGCEFTGQQVQRILKTCPKLLTLHRRMCNNIGCWRNLEEVPKGQVTMQKCGRCKRVAYCSKECQRADWKDHKQECSAPAVAKKVLVDNRDLTVHIASFLGPRGAARLMSTSSAARASLSSVSADRIWAKLFHWLDCTLDAQCDVYLERSDESLYKRLQAAFRRWGPVEVHDGNWTFRGLLPVFKNMLQNTEKDDYGWPGCDVMYCKWHGR